MVSVQSKVKIVDNSGVKLVKCIHFVNKVKQKASSKICSVFLGVILDFVSFKKANSFKKGGLVFCIVLRSKKNFINIKGSGFYFKANKTVAIICKTESKARQVVVGSRFFGPIPFIFRNKIFSKEEIFLVNSFY